MNIVFFTGAGMSAASGLATFRGPNGLYEDDELEIQDYLTLSYFKKHPGKAWDWLRVFIAEMTNAKYNEGHEIIASFQNASVVTQNIDCFHQQAGSKEVVELHGSVDTCKCIECGKEQPLREKCDCGSWTKPDIVFYEECLNFEKIKQSRVIAEKADVFVIIGTSGVVWPAAELPVYAEKCGATVFEINPDQPSFPPYSPDRYIKKNAIEGLKELKEKLERLYPS